MKEQFSSQDETHEAANFLEREQILAGIRAVLIAAVGRDRADDDLVERAMNNLHNRVGTSRKAEEMLEVGLRQVGIAIYFDDDRHTDRLSEDEVLIRYDKLSQLKIGDMVTYQAGEGEFRIVAIARVNENPGPTGVSIIVETIQEQGSENTIRAGQEVLAGAMELR